MKNVIRIALGFLPLVVGSIENAYMTSHPDILPPFRLIGTVILIGWAVASYNLADVKPKPAWQALEFSVLGLLALILVIVQEVFLGSYWLNFIGIATQLYCLPLISLPYILPLPRIWMMDIRIWLVLFFISICASRIKMRKLHEKEHP